MTSIRVLVVDDSKTLRDLIVGVLSVDPGIVVVGTANGGVEAIERARALRPDVITMDLQMPQVGGLQAIRTIMGETPARIICVAAGGDEDEIDLSFRAIGAGALELILKPGSRAPYDLDAWGARLRESVRLMAEVPVVRRHRGAAGASPAHPGYDAVGIVASTGGPNVLAALLAELPRDLPAAIFAAQHIAPGFAGGLKRWLASATPLSVDLVEDRAVISRGRVFLPADGLDLVLDGPREVRASPGATLHCPSANRLLASLADAYGRRALAVVLTGMGEDGADGVREVIAAGGAALAQDGDSVVVDGMPKAAELAGAVRVDLAELAGRVTSMCRGW